MKIFVSELRVARALSRGADWRACVLADRGRDGAGCVTNHGSGVSGVVADVADRGAIDAYFVFLRGLG